MSSNGTALAERFDDDITVVDTPGIALEAQTRGEIDVQITTARRYPRSIRLFLDTARQMATLDEHTAEACFYALPRGGKTIEGPSARLAEIVASAWGHMRIEARVIAEDDKFLTARGAAWDLQNNVAFAVEVRRRITDKSGRKFQDDMIVVTANAACSIALRNAIFKVIPNAFTQQIYHEARRVAVGDASTLVDRRGKVLSGFQKMGVSVDRVYALLGIKGEEDITLDHLGTLRGLGTAIRQGDTTVDEAFPLPGAVAAAAAPKAKGVEAVAKAVKAKTAEAEGVAEPEAAPEPESKLKRISEGHKQLRTMLELRGFDLLEADMPRMVAWWLMSENTDMPLEFMLGDLTEADWKTVNGKLAKTDTKDIAAMLEKVRGTDQPSSDLFKDE